MIRYSQHYWKSHLWCGFRLGFFKIYSAVIFMWRTTKHFIRYTRPPEKDLEAELQKAAVCWDEAEQVSRWPSFRWSGVTWKEAEEKARACDAGWGQGGEGVQAELCEPRAAGRRPGAKAQRWDVSKPWGSGAAAAVRSSLLFQCTWEYLSQQSAETSTGTEEMWQRGKNTSSQHPMITKSTQHPQEHQSLASYLTKSAKIIISERKKFD